MKPMTEQEARAALKAEMPWARGFCVEEAGSGYEAMAMVWCGTVNAQAAVHAFAPTLRAAVAKAIKAWRATQKGAKR